MKPKLPRGPFILAGMLIVLLAMLGGDYLSQPSYDLYQKGSFIHKLNESPWDAFANYPRQSIGYALNHGRILSRGILAMVARGFGFLAGLIWLLPMIFIARRPGGSSLVRLRNLLKLLFAGILVGIIVGAICGGLVHLYIHTMGGLRELTSAEKMGGLYVGLVFGGGAGAILGLIGGWQMWVVQLAVLRGMAIGKEKQMTSS
ncbi:MAG: hypothetical protein JXA11_09220 [Phycisphaerae bacterium]|nr:hypothetical protein [Phycisphaerae bacterium]